MRTGKITLFSAASILFAIRIPEFSNHKTKPTSTKKFHHYTHTYLHNNILNLHHLVSLNKSQSVFYKLCSGKNYKICGRLSNKLGIIQNKVNEVRGISITWTTCTRVKYPLFQVFSAKNIKIYSIRSLLRNPHEYSVTITNNNINLDVII